VTTPIIYWDRFIGGPFHGQPVRMDPDFLSNARVYVRGGPKPVCYTKWEFVGPDGRCFRLFVVSGMWLCEVDEAVRLALGLRPHARIA
jgi:hypothetical protein